MIVHRHVMFVLAVVTALVTPVAASAAIRVASPGGAPSTACPAATPCDLDTAVNSAIDGDEIVLLAGVYTGFPSLNPGGRVLNIHGADGEPRPTLTSPQSTLRVGVGSTIKRLTITTSQPTVGPLINVTGNGPAIVDLVGVVIDEVFARAPGEVLSFTNAGLGNHIRNSILVSDSGGQETLRIQDTNQVALEHATVLARGTALRALHVLATTTATSVTISNSIVRGTNEDIRAAGVGATVALAHSAYRPTLAFGAVANGAGVITNDPLFADPANGDFHEAPGSPTIDAGDASAVQADFDGQPRSIGAAPDIGADEVPIAAVVATDAPTALTLTGATLNGRVIPNGLTTSYRFEYGTTTTYGLTTANAPAGADAKPHSVEAAIAGLTPGTTYHARIVATSVLGQIAGDDITFVTTSDMTAPRIAKLILTSKSITPGKRLTLRLTLDEAANVKVTIERMTPGRHVGARCVPEAKTGAKCVKLTRVTTFSRALAAAGLAKVVVPAKPGGKKLQRGTYRLVVQATDAAGNSSPAKRITFTVA